MSAPEQDQTDLVLEATGIAAGKPGTFAADRYDRMPYRRSGRSGLLFRRERARERALERLARGAGEARPA